MNWLCLLMFSLWLHGTPPAFGDQNSVSRQVHTQVPAEATADAKIRHERVEERRKRTHIICHRGASEFAHENTLEAYRATFELGADGNEIDIRTTKDGVLVCFHDDMLDHLLEAFGDVSDFNWEELHRFPFRDPGPYGKYCRIPTLVEVFDLHRKHGGLLHLDIKRPKQDRAIADLLDRMDMWDHVAYCNEDNAGIILQHPKLRLCRYKGPGLYADRSEVDPQAIAEILKKPGDGVIVDDPRGILVSLGRQLGKVSSKPVAPLISRPEASKQVLPIESLIATLRNAEGWSQVQDSVEEKASSACRISERAKAADKLLAVGASSKEVFDVLEDRVRHRSLHKDWQYQGLDGAMALRSLILLHAPKAVELARFTLWRDDPGLEPVVNPRWSNPRSWTDFRIKMVVFPALQKYPGAATEQLCRDYLALTDEAAKQIGPPLFGEAAKTLLAVCPQTKTALELMKHRLKEVRGQTILECLRNGSETWARGALERGAPHALAYIAFAEIPNLSQFKVTENEQRIIIESPTIEVSVRKQQYVSGVEAQSFLDKKTGFRDLGYGLDIVDWLMEPGSDAAYRDRLAGDLPYLFDNRYHGKRAKRSIEGPQICTKAGRLTPKVIQSRDFVAVQQDYKYHLAAPGKQTGSQWEQTLVFPAGQRYFLCCDKVTTVNSSEALFLRIDMPGHIKHKGGDTFSEVYLSYRGKLPAKEFLDDFPPDEKFLYVRGAEKIPDRFIRAYHLRDPKTGKDGPWLAGMTLDPAAVSEAWCHQRGYVCMIEEFGGRPIKAGQSFSAAFVVGFFDSIEEMNQIYDRHAGRNYLEATAENWKLSKLP